MSVQTAREETQTAASPPQPEVLIRRVVAVLGLLGIALIHLIDVPSKFPDSPLIGVAFLALIVTSLVIAEALTRTSSPAAWVAAARVAAAPISGYVTSRTVGLPGNGGGDDIGNWGEGLGIASLFVEGAVVLVSLAALARRRHSP